MTEPVADDFRRDAGLERERRVRVAQLVQAYRRQLCRLRVPLETIGERLRVDHAAELVREHVVA